MGIQADIGNWVVQVLGKKSLDDSRTRVTRFLEEASELVQAVGLSEEEAQAVVSYVYNRPVGDPAQEIGGCMATLYAASEGLGVDADTQVREEFTRINTPEIIAKVRRRDPEKDKAISQILDAT